MPTFDILKESKPIESFRVQSVRDQFDLDIQKVSERFTGAIDIEDKDWNIGAIYGASGTGKTTIAKQLFGDDYIRAFAYDERPVIDNMPDGLSVKDITATFNSVGFATVWSWLKPYDVLSTGEKMRVDLARAILQEREVIVFDEFTSVVNREVAKHGSYAIQKAVRKKDKRFVAVSCHYDILEWLEPDWLFNTDKMEFRYARGSLQRPSIRLDIREVDKKLWAIFRRYHYLNTSLNPSSVCFAGFINKIPVAFFAVLHFPHSKTKKFKRGHRLVVLPDYQGLGIGHALSSYVARRYVEDGFRFIITSSTRSLYYQRSRDKNWRVSKPTRKLPISSSSGPKDLNKTISTRKYTYSYEYIKRARD